MAKASDTVREAANTSAAGPLEGEFDGRRIRQHSIKDQIELAKYNKKVESASENKLPFQMRRTKSAGAE